MRWAPDMVWLDVDPIIPRYPDELSSLQLLNGIVEVLEQGTHMDLENALPSKSKLA